MRNLLLLLAGAALTLIVIVACRARDDSDADATGEDTARADGSVRDSVAGARDTTRGDVRVAPTASPARRAASTPRDMTEYTRTSGLPGFGRIRPTPKYS